LTVAVKARPSSVDALYNLGVALLKSSASEENNSDGGDGRSVREKAQECFHKVTGEFVCIRMGGKK